MYSSLQADLYVFWANPDRLSGKCGKIGKLNWKVKERVQDKFL